MSMKTSSSVKGLIILVGLELGVGRAELTGRVELTGITTERATLAPVVLFI